LVAKDVLGLKVGEEILASLKSLSRTGLIDGWFITRLLRQTIVLNNEALSIFPKWFLVNAYCHVLSTKGGINREGGILRIAFDLNNRFAARYCRNAPPLLAPLMYPFLFLLAPFIALGRRMFRMAFRKKGLSFTK
jgi:hypothetical protein